MNAVEKISQNSNTKVTIPKNIGKNIKIAMAISGINQKKLAELIGCSPTEISFWTTNKRMPNIIELKKISEIFKKPMEWFFKEIE